MSFPELLAFIASAFRKFIRPYKSATKVIIEDIKADNPPPVVLQEPATAPLPPKPTEPMPPRDIEHTSELYPDWDTPKRARHNVRAICDQEGLTLKQKDILTACVANESGFLVNPKPNQNKDKTGKVWSTDYGIVQVNDYFNIGKGKPFPSVKYVLENPEACVRWMARYYKKTGNLNLWASYTSGIYKRYL